MKSRLHVAATMVVALFLAGSILNRVQAPVWQAARAKQPALRLEPSVATAGQGVTLALLGGFRALVADGTWVRMYALWERRDLASVQALLQLVVAIDPRPIYFWINGARIIAHDFAAWRIEAAGGAAIGPSAERQIDRQQGSLALRHLDAAMAFHPANPDLWIERANIEMMRMHDLEAAAESFRRAWEQPRAPYYAARLHAELLRRLGRKSEALAWLIQLYPTLPAGEEAGRDRVLERIRELERDLHVPPEQAFQAPAR